MCIQQLKSLHVKTVLIILEHFPFQYIPGHNQKYKKIWYRLRTHITYKRVAVGLHVSDILLLSVGGLTYLDINTSAEHTYLSKCPAVMQRQQTLFPFPLPSSIKRIIIVDRFTNGLQHSLCISKHWCSNFDQAKSYCELYIQIDQELNATHKTLLECESHCPSVETLELLYCSSCLSAVGFYYFLYIFLAEWGIMILNRMPKARG